MYRFLLCFVFTLGLSAAELHNIKGTVVDPSGAPVAGAQVSVVTQVGVFESVVAPNGAFSIDAPTGSKLTITARGFAPKSIALDDARSMMNIQLDLAAVVDSVRVVGSAIDVAPSEQGGSVTIIGREEIGLRNEPAALDLLRTAPGIIFNQTGPAGTLAGLYIRGGYPTFTLVQIDGVPVNAFGGDFDFAHVPTESLERIEVIRGSQSAIYGPYANSGVVNFVTRQPQSSANFDALAEGGTYHHRRFGLGGGGSVAGFWVAASASQMNTDGPVANSDYRNQDLLLNVSRRFKTQSIYLHGGFNSNENGVPGAWGSDPKGTFTGLDLVSRNKNNFSEYLARYQADISPMVREEISGAFFQNNNGYTSPYGFSGNKDLRVQGDARTVVSAARHYVAAFGITAAHEQVENSYVTDASFNTFPLRRRDIAIYLENRFEFGNRLFLNAGVRGEFLRTGAIPGDGYARPYFPAQTISTASPKFAAAYVLKGVRFHSSFATGIRPPNKFDLAYTNNPALKPERTRSFDAGLEKRLLRDRLSLDATYFYNRFHDLIVILGGSLSRLSAFQTDNIANSRADGGEFSARVRPASWLFVEGSYTLLLTEILSLRGASGVAQQPFAVGQELIRRPRNSGAFTAGFHRGRIAGNVTGQFRGSTLDVEPAFGATNGLFRNPGYSYLGINLNYALGRGLTAYGNLRNALNRRYEEVFGYPSPRLNFVAGLKWSLAGIR